MQEKDFETPDGARAPMDVAEFYDSLETKRMARLDGLVQQYNSIESLLIKVKAFFNTLFGSVVVLMGGKQRTPGPS